MPAVRTSLRALTALLVVAALGLITAGSTATPLSGSADRCAAGRARDVTVNVVSGGLRRSTLVHVPAGVRRPAPLILAFHGAGATGPFMQRYSGLSRAAAPRGMIVAYPTAVRSIRRWTLPGDGPGNPDDVGFTGALLDRLDAQMCIDPERVYATGISNGGGFAASLACRLADRIAAIAPVAGRYDDGPCDPRRPVSVLEIHGTADAVVPYRGGPPDRAAAVRPWMQAWAARDRCSQAPRRRVIAPWVVRVEWSPCPAGVSVVHIAIVGGTHAWPGASPPDPGPVRRISAAPDVVRFFAGRRLASPSR